VGSLGVSGTTADSLVIFSGMMAANFELADVC
jgi:hypothetical protein